MLRVHVAYHHRTIRDAVAGALSREPGLRVTGVTPAGAEGAEAVAQSRPDVVVLSQPWGDDAAEWVGRYRAAAAGAKVVLLCGTGLRESALGSGADAEVDVADGSDAIAAAVRAVAG